MNCISVSEELIRESAGKLAIATVEGVEQVEVSLHQGTASVAGSAKEEEIMQAVESIGFKASKTPD